MRTRQLSLAFVLAVISASLISGRLWPVAVDRGGLSAGNPISRYGPHWLYPTVAGIVTAGLLAALLFVRLTAGTVAAVTLFAAGAASNLAQWVLLGGVSNPIGPVPGVHGSSHVSIGDLCLWLGAVALAMASVRHRAVGPAGRHVDAA